MTNSRARGDPPQASKVYPNSWVEVLFILSTSGSHKISSANAIKELANVFVPLNKNVRNTEVKSFIVHSGTGRMYDIVHKVRDRVIYELYYWYCS